MISEALAFVEAPGILREVRSAPPLTIRQVLSEQDGTCALCLVGSAAGPLPGDDLTLRIDLAPGAHATLVAAGATIAQGRGSTPARLRIEVTLGAGASLAADPGELIVCAGTRVDVSVAITLADDADLTWREVIVLGRTSEEPGAAVLDWDAHRGGQPLLRQRIDLSDPVLRSWPGHIGGHRKIESTLRVGPTIEATTVVHSPSHVTQKLAENATLATRLT